MPVSTSTEIKPPLERRMATAKQILGAKGEKFIVSNFACLKCKGERTLRCLPSNFKCADVICDFCGYLAQVKTASVRKIDSIPRFILGAAWGPQKQRMKAGIFFPLFLVLANPIGEIAVYYLSADLQNWGIFKPRKPLSPTARRAGWQGFLYDLESVRTSLVRLY